MRHALTVVQKNAPTTPVRDLSSAEIGTLVDYFQGGVRTPKLLAVLQELHERKQWVLCGCSGAEQLVERPALVVARTGEGKLYIRNIPSRPTHSLECPFAYTPTTSTEIVDRGLNADIARRALADQPPTPATLRSPLDLHLAPALGATSGTSAPTKHRDRTPSGHGKRYPELGKVLFYLMEQAGMLTQTAEFELLKSFHFMAKAAQAILAFGAVPLSDVLSFSPKTLDSLTRRVKMHSASGEKNAFGMAVMIIHEIESLGAGKYELRRTSSEESWSCCPKGEVKIMAKRSISKGPFIAAITYAVPLGETEPVPFHVFAVPILNRNRTLPVESDLERRAAISLLRLFDWALEKKGLKFTITKPVFDVQAPMGDCRPDFVVKGLSRTAIVEVMGMMGSEEYEEQKSRTIPVMESLAPVVQVDLSGSLSKSELDNRLRDMNKAILNVIFNNEPR